MTALDELTTLLPPPPGAGRASDWGAVEHRLGVTALPDDFKQLLGVYGDVRFCNALRLFRPATHRWLDLAEVTLAARETLGSSEFGVPPDDVPAGVSIDPADADPVGWLLRRRLLLVGRPRSRPGAVDAGVH